ncbi:hypothetical protein [Paludisphaera rhizosphaerae]|uniref:hypothetical protein n=1 Tax=Paludisphaera rhizosphaerae TaxID=2711216 RepID=UPI001981B2FC|nr:hypothetical protein [Paludisphaera rhizosphaerae]
MTLWTTTVVLCGSFIGQIPQDSSLGPGAEAMADGPRFKNITLEMSLKPFKKNEPDAIRAVCRQVFTQWAPLLRRADQVSIMMWTADGSEILEYTGEPSQRLEWGRYLGNPNSGRAVGSDPDAPLSIHDRAFLYMENPPEYTLGDLRSIVAALKDEGRRATGKPVRVGATFDPGPEFARSDFKYKKHPEICMSATMGAKSFVCCYAVLHADSSSYAGFPQGIPEGTPFGVFLGRQAQRFLTDMGYDYLWFSNGLGFGLEPWSSTGAVFDGKSFRVDKLTETRARIKEFWEGFRRECPSLRIETRGTNLATGIDLAKDGVDLRAIYTGGYNILPPPNSPWAALDGDFGLELAGFLSRMAELPAEDYLFRFYTHDPWWINSPWIDRYGREPHDVYLPSACTRVDHEGRVVPPSHLNILTVDDSFGNMPDRVPNEVIPRILEGRRDAPDAPGPFVWVYPWDAYHDAAQNSPGRLPEVFAGDWTIRQAINAGFPLNTVVSTTGFLDAIAKKSDLFRGCVLVTTVPEPGSAFETHLLQDVQGGGQAMVYGPLRHASPAFLEAAGLAVAEPIDGEFDVETDLLHGDELKQAHYPTRIRHDALVNGGGVESVAKGRGDESTRMLASLKGDGRWRDLIVATAQPEWKGGKIVYARGTHSNRYTGGRLLRPDDPDKYLDGGMLMRAALREFGYTFDQAKLRPSQRSPVVCVARSKNGYFLSGYTPDTTVEQRLRFPQGAPLLLGLETILNEGRSTYQMPRGWHRECRVFVDQPAGGRVGFNELHSNERGVTRRLEVDGLADASVIFYPDADAREENIRVYLNGIYPWMKNRIPFEKGPERFGRCYQVKGVTGRLAIAW